MTNPQKHGYAPLDAATFAVLVESLIYLGDVKNSNDVFRECLNPEHPYYFEMIKRAQLLLEMGVIAYLNAVETTVSGITNGAIDSSNLPPMEKSYNNSMRYLLASKRLFNVNKFYPRDQASNNAFAAFKIVYDDQTIVYNERLYRETLTSMWDQLKINRDYSIWVPISLKLQSTLTRIASGSLVLDGRWRDGVTIQLLPTYIPQAIILIADGYIKQYYRIPQSASDLTITMFNHINS